MIEYIFIAFIVVFCIQLCYYIVIFGFFSFEKGKPNTSYFNKPISIIICAKNEAKNLKENLPFFIKQHYENFELVLINDSSTDNTLAVFKEFKKQFPDKIKIVDVKANEQFWGNKKYALTLGIKAASNEYLLFSDADCKPVSENWAQEMTHKFTQKKHIILGYGSYKKDKRSLLNKLIRFETLLTAIQYFSYSKIGIPYMGVGRNLAYTKSLFFKTNGFVNHMHLKSGDDDLFINQIATKHNTSICYSSDSFTVSSPKTNLKSWIQQKRRHISTANYYKKHHQFLLATFYNSQLLFWLLGSVLLIALYNWQLIVVLIITRFLVQYIVLWNAAKKLQEKDIVVLTPVLELFLISLHLFIFIKNLISKPTHW